MRTNTARSYSPMLFCLFLFLINSTNLQAQKKKIKNSNTPTYEEDIYKSVQWRQLGPFRGGRSCAVVGVLNKPNLFYFGATGGGVWKTEDGGRIWSNISDGFFGGSIGAIAVSESDNNVIYVGGGEQTLRGNVSSGSGMWKSVDAGKNWEQIGLEQSRHIARIRIHPTDHSIVYAAVIGNIYKGHQQRGVFKSIDGGKTWKKTLFVNDEVGAADLCFDPNNPRIMYATTWRVKRTPSHFSSGGEGSAVWKSTDGGDTWTDISKNEGMPKGTLGISGITVSPVNSERVWAIIEAKEGGVFRSDNAGKTWKKINSERKLRQRAWYYTRIYADTQDEDMVYVLNVRYHRSKDGGKTFERFSAEHSDHHDLWIAPENAKRMVIADDGGAQVTYDGGETWSTYYNQPTAQFYRVTTDNHFPYRIYAAQQDNSTIRIPHRTSGGSIGENDWESTAGCECGHIAIDPRNNDIVYGGCYDGYLQRKDHANDQNRTINVWPDNPMGYGAEGMRYRFQWNFPIFFSPHDPNKLYTCSNHLHVSTNEGQTWEIISPDLTRNDSTKLGTSGGPITQDNTSVEYYCTIFAALESPRQKDLLWTGSDDGLIHVSKDGGKNWKNVTPSNMPKWIMINSIEADPFNDGGLYVAATMYKSGDFKPYLYKTTDYGATWTKIVTGIDDEHFTRVIRADPNKEGLLYAGTENGVYISFNDGKKWQALQLNLPIVPITDLAVKEGNLIAATQGRSLWIIDDLSPFHQLSSEITSSKFHLYQPKDTYRLDGWQQKESKTTGTNHAAGLMVHYFVKEAEKKDSITLSFLEEDGTLIRSFSTKAKEKKDKLKVEKGANLFTWNMVYPDAKKFDGMILWWASLNGPKALPGKYKIQLDVNGKSKETSFTLLKDPRSTSTDADLKKQFDFVKDIRDKITEAHEAIINIRDVRAQLKNYTKRLEDDEEMLDVIETANAIDSTMTVVEETLYQTKNRSPQDPLNFPIRLTNKLGHLVSITRGGNYPPTDQAIAVKNELTAKIDEQLEQYKKIIETDLPAFNALVKSKAVDAIILKKEKD